MKLFMLRHAIAAERKDWNKPDAQRPLTKDGARKMKKAAKGMREMKIRFDSILTSPYARALDTARIVGKVYKETQKIQVVPCLATEGQPRDFIKLLAQQARTKKSVLVVGHEPYLGQLIGVLTTGQSGAEIELKKGGLASLEADDLTYGKCAHLQWILPPRVLRQLASL